MRNPDESVSRKVPTTAMDISNFSGIAGAKVELQTITSRKSLLSKIISFESRAKPNTNFSAQNKCDY